MSQKLQAIFCFNQLFSLQMKAIKYFLLPSVKYTIKQTLLNYFFPKRKKKGKDILQANQKGK